MDARSPSPSPLRTVQSEALGSAREAKERLTHRVAELERTLSRLNTWVIASLLERVKKIQLWYFLVRMTQGTTPSNPIQSLYHLV